MRYAIGTYASFRSWAGEPVGLDIQNFHAAEARTWDGRSYMWADFGFSGSTLDTQGASISAQLIFTHSTLLLDSMQTAADERWLVQVQTVWMEPDTLREMALYSLELFMVLGFEHDFERVTVRLGSPLDAINQQVPRRVLSRRLVGALPSTGNIPLR